MDYNEARFKANANDGTVPWRNDPHGRPFRGDRPMREIAAFGCDREVQGGSVCPHWCGQDKCGVVLAEPPTDGVKTVEVPSNDPAPPNSLPDWYECQRILDNANFRKRAAAGLEGSVLDTPPTTPEPTELHRFIYDYDDADPHRSAWFRHRLELVLKEARTCGVALPRADDAALSRLRDTQRVLVEALTLGRHHAQWSVDRSKDVTERRMCEHDVKRIDAALASVEQPEQPFHLTVPADEEVTAREVCRFPDCKCPMDPGPEPDWCARGLPHARASGAQTVDGGKR